MMALNKRRSKVCRYTERRVAVNRWLRSRKGVLNSRYGLALTWRLTDCDDLFKNWFAVFNEHLSTKRLSQIQRGGCICTKILLFIFVAILFLVRMHLLFVSLRFWQLQPAVRWISKHSGENASRSKCTLLIHIREF